MNQEEIVQHGGKISAMLVGEISLGDDGFRLLKVIG